MMLHFFRERRYDQLTHDHFSGRSISKLGEGSYGVAYLLDGTSVVKRLKCKRFSIRHRAKFAAEVDFLQRLQHLPVPRLLGTGSILDTPYYEMSYVDGHTFEQEIFVNNKGFHLDEVFRYTRELLLIARDMHATGIVHRDLRIPNILLCEGCLVVIDFGLACEIDTSFDVTDLRNPKTAPHPLSDLYQIGHFMLFLLYSSYEAKSWRSRSWQQELVLPSDVVVFIERLLTIREPFLSAVECLKDLERLVECLKATDLDLIIEKR